MSGPPPTPTRLKLLRGNPGKRPINLNEPQPLAIMQPPRCPSELARDPFGRKEWNRRVAELTRLGILTTLDTGALLAMCFAYAHAMRAETQYRDEGYNQVVENKNGTWRNPLLSIIDSEWKRYRAFQSDLGLNPASRSRLSVSKPKDEADPNFGARTNEQGYSESLSR